MRHLARVMPDQDEIRLDLRGLKCPLPALRTRSALSRLPPGAILVVECTDPLSGIDIPHLLRDTGDVLEGQGRQGSVLTFRVRKSGLTPSETAG